MTEASRTGHEPKSLSRPSPKPEENDDATSLNRPLSGASGQRGGWYEQHRGGVVAGPSRQRPASGASAATQQTAYRVPREDLDLTEEHTPYRIGTPSIERAAGILRESHSRIGTPSIERNASHPSLPRTGGQGSRSVKSRDQQQDEDTFGEPSDGPSVPKRGKSNHQKRNSRGSRRTPSEGLNEVTGPAPVQRSEDPGWRREEHLEDDYGNTGPPTNKPAKPHPRRASEGLTEVDAPEPVQSRSDSSGWRMQEHLEDEHGSEQSALPPPSFARKEERSTKSPSALATKLYTYSYLIFFSILGTLARLGTQWLTFYPGAPIVTSVIWANVGGSLFMGFLFEDRQIFSEEWGDVKEKSGSDDKADEEAAKKNHGKVKKTIPLYIGLATGFCGSFTSFSSFQRDVFLALSNNVPTPINHPHDGIPAPSFTSTVHRNGGYSFMALLAVIIYTVALSLAALFVGAHIAIALDPWTPTISFKFGRKVLDRLMVVLGPLCWLGAIFSAIWPPDRPGASSSRGSWANEVWRGEVLFAIVFSPLGCFVRYYASLKLNPIMASFPLGTFTVNIFGCAIEAMCYDIQHVSLLSVGGGLIGGGRVGCQVLQGMMDGFCGCLTTVSTWVAELQALRRRHAYIYGLVSLAVGLGVMVIIMGSVRWTAGFSETACVTMRTSM